MTARLIRILSAAACAGIALSCTEPLPTENETDALVGLTVPQLEVGYDLDSTKVRCTWTAPSEPVSFYRLYRAVIGTGGEQAEMVTEGPRSRIPGGLTSYMDVVGLRNAGYRYSIRAVRIRSVDSVVTPDGTVRDTQYVEGPGSPVDTCFVGTGISFSINDGALFTRYDTVSLYVVDRNNVLERADFSANSQFSSPTSVVLNTDTTVTTASWTLAKGPGTKVVWGRLHYRGGGDTIIQDDIDIAPYNVQIKLRNETRRPNETMRVWYALNDSGDYSNLQRKTIDRYVVYRPFVEFGISIFSDSTFARDFEYWLVFPDSAAKSTDDAYMIHTAVKHDSLTAIGAGHDDFHKYGYSFDPDSMPGLLNLAKGLTLIKESDTVTISPGPRSAYDKLAYLPGVAEQGQGKKEFYIVAKFTGRYFGEERVVASSGFQNAKSPFASYYDAYPPFIMRDWFRYYFPRDGATIDGAININLNTSGQIYDDSGKVISNRGVVWDKGGADVAAIDLIIAEMPDLMVAEWDSAETPPTLTEDSIRTFRHHVFEFGIGARRDSRIYPVYWNNIDPSGWPSGWYLVAIVTEDSFGHRGIAPLNYQRYLGSPWNCNPQHWRIVTGETGL